MELNFRFNQVSLVFVSLCFACISNQAFSQSVTTYGFVAISGTYTPLSGATGIPLSNYDNGNANNLPIGFSFKYSGTSSNTFNVCADGFLTFGSSGVMGSTTYSTNDLSSNGKRPLVAPLWDDLLVTPPAVPPATPVENVSYKIEGAQPKRILTVQWDKIKWNRNATSDVIAFQVKLYETSNVIEFVYQCLGSYNTGSGGASIGLTDAPMGYFKSVSGLSSTATSSTTTSANLIEGPITSAITGLIYRFTPPCSTENVPYSENFDFETAPVIPRCWTTLDANTDSYSWSTQTSKYSSSPNSLTYITNTTTAADDWAFTPAFNLTGGVTYNLTFAEATTTGAENLEVKYGNAATTAGMTTTAAIYVSLSNNSFVTKTIAITPASSGIFYIGFHCTSTANQGSLYIDDISLGTKKNWIGSGAGGTGTDFNDGSNWSPAGTPTLADDLIMNINIFGTGANSPHADLSAGADANSLAITFTGNTNNVRKAFTLNTNSSNLNITNFLVLANASTGTGGGTGTTPGHTLTLNINGGITTVGKVDVTNSSPGSFPLTNVAISTAGSFNTKGDLKALIISGSNSQISINNSGMCNVGGSTLANSTIGSGKILFDVKNPNASYVFTGNATFDDGSSSSSSDIYLGGNKVGFMTFLANASFGAIVKSTGSNMIGSITFDASVSQTITVNSANLNTIKFIAGKSASNSPLVSLTGSQNLSLFSSSSSALTINNSSVLDLTSRSLNISGTQAGTLSMSAGSTMKLGAISGGANQNNFPGNYLVYTLNPTSTVEYNSLGNQDITGLVNTSVVTYGNLLLTASGSNNLRTLKTSVIVNGNLTSAGGAILDLNNYVLTVNKDVIGFSGAISGRFKANQYNDATQNSGLILGGSGTINFDASYNYLKTLTINAPSAPGPSITLGNLLNIAAGSIVNGVDNYGTVTVNGKLYSNGFLTLKSNESGTSRIAESTGGISGDVTVERFIKAKRAWRFLAVPFASSSQTIRDAWQEGVNNTDLVYANNQNPNPGFGTHITYDNVVSPNHGFDLNTTTNGSIAYYNQSINDFPIAAPLTISTNIADHNGYLIFIRGSRAVNLSQATSAIPDNTVLRIKGIINQGTIPQNFTNYTISDNLFIANPYASSIDLTNVFSHSTGIIPDQFSIWDPFLSGEYGVGGYRQYSHNLKVPFDEYNPPTNSTIIQSGQAFMLKANDLHSVINFHESDKATTENFVQGGSYQSAAALFPRLYVNLKAPSFDSLVTIDGIGAVFDTSFSRYIKDEDVRKLFNNTISPQGESITMVRNDTDLAIEAYPYPITIKDTMNIRLYSLNSSTYNLKFFPQYIPPFSSTVELLDLYLNTTTPLSLSNPTTYNFTAVQGDTSTFRNRFKVVLKLNGAAFVKHTGKSNNQISNKKKAAIKIYPNPVVSDKVYVRLENFEEGKYSFELLDNTGRLLKTKEVIVNNSYFIDYLNVGKSWASGKYQLVIFDSKSSIISSNAIVISKGSNE